MRITREWFDKGPRNHLIADGKQSLKHPADRPALSVCFPQSKPLDTVRVEIEHAELLDLVEAVLQATTKSHEAQALGAGALATLRALITPQCRTAVARAQAL